MNDVENTYGQYSMFGLFVVAVAAALVSNAIITASRRPTGMVSIGA